MKLLQLNIWEGKLLKEVLAFVEKEKPDILCLQEVYSSTEDIPLPDMMFDSLQQIQKIAGYKHSFFSPFFTAIYAGAPASFGMAIVSKLPLTNTRSFFTNGSYNPNLTLKTRVSNTRILQICQLEIDGKTLNLANHHGHRESDPLGSAASIEKMKLVKSKLEGLPIPLILSGDLNVKSESPAMRVFDGFLIDQTAEHKTKTTLSQFGKFSGIACDHILISDDIKVTEFRVANDLVSDHKALIMEFEL